MILALFLCSPSSPSIQASCSTLCFCTFPLFLVLYMLLSDTKSYTLPLENASQAVIREFQVIRLSLRSGPVDKGNDIPIRTSAPLVHASCQKFGQKCVWREHRVVACRFRGYCWTSQGTLLFDVSDAESVSGHATFTEICTGRGDRIYL